MTVKTAPLTRRIRYQDQELPDSNPAAPIQDVVRGYASLYPELLNADVEGPVNSDDQREALYTVKARASYKG